MYTEAKKLKTNADLDKAFNEAKEIIDDIPTPSNFEDIYDFTKRFINQYGVGKRLVEKVYLLGYMAGKDSKDNNA